MTKTLEDMVGHSYHLRSTGNRGPRLTGGGAGMAGLNFSSRNEVSSKKMCKQDIEKILLWPKYLMGYGEERNIITGVLAIAGVYFTQSYMSAQDPLIRYGTAYLAGGAVTYLASMYTPNTPGGPYRGKGTGGTGK